MFKNKFGNSGVSKGLPPRLFLNSISQVRNNKITNTTAEPISGMGGLGRS